MFPFPVFLLLFFQRSTLINWKPESKSTFLVIEMFHPPSFIIIFIISNFLVNKTIRLLAFIAIMVNDSSREKIEIYLERDIDFTREIKNFLSTNLIQVYLSSFFRIPLLLFFIIFFYFQLKPGLSPTYITLRSRNALNRAQRRRGIPFHYAFLRLPFPLPLPPSLVVIHRTRHGFNAFESLPRGKI